MNRTTLHCRQAFQLVECSFLRGNPLHFQVPSIHHPGGRRRIFGQSREREGREEGVLVRGKTLVGRDQLF
jgi:hypothetical protein